MGIVFAANILAPLSAKKWRFEPAETNRLLSDCNLTHVQVMCLQYSVTTNVVTVPISA